MSRKKLTLSVKKRLTRRAKAIADKRGTSVSRLVETFFVALGHEEENTGVADRTREQGDEGGVPIEVSADSSAAGDEPSEWGRQWRGAFVEEGATYPDDPTWGEELLAEEMEKKHAS